MKSAHPAGHRSATRYWPWNHRSPQLRVYRSFPVQISRPVRGPAFFTGAGVDAAGVAAVVNAAGGGGMEAGSKSGCITRAATKAAAGGGGNAGNCLGTATGEAGMVSRRNGRSSFLAAGSAAGGGGVLASGAAGGV